MEKRHRTQRAKHKKEFYNYPSFQIHLHVAVKTTRVKENTHIRVNARLIDAKIRINGADWDVGMELLQG